MTVKWSEHGCLAFGPTLGLQLASPPTLHRKLLKIFSQTSSRIIIEISIWGKPGSCFLHLSGLHERQRVRYVNEQSLGYLRYILAHLWSKKQILHSAIAADQLLITIICSPNALAQAISLNCSHYISINQEFKDGLDTVGKTYWENGEWNDTAGYQPNPISPRVQPLYTGLPRFDWKNSPFILTAKPARFFEVRLTVI